MTRKHSASAAHDLAAGGVLGEPLPLPPTNPNLVLTGETNDGNHFGPTGSTYFELNNSLLGPSSVNDYIVTSVTATDDSGAVIFDTANAYFDTGNQPLPWTFGFNDFNWFVIPTNASPTPQTIAAASVRVIGALADGSPFRCDYNGPLLVKG